MFYLANTPFWLRMVFPKNVVWQGDPSGNKVYLSFDDGPTPVVTRFVLDLLDKYGYKATFFCIGDNVKKHPEIFNLLQAQGHRAGNHTMHHPNGWKTPADAYVAEILEADKLIGSGLFRPPYGKITEAQAKKLCDANGSAHQTMQIIMWSVITGDFDTTADGDTCFNRVVKHTKPGSIIVFHDSEKAFPRLKTALPKTLEWIKQQGLQPALIG